MIWQTKSRSFDLSRRALIMGVLNVTTDSFSDGGKFIDIDRAVAHGKQLAAEGAEIIDVGGESTRPGAKPVPEQEELRRVVPVIEALHAALPDSTISIDTMKPAVARAAVAAGAAIINDVTGLRDPAMREAVRETGAAAIIMHMQGVPRDMQQSPQYDNVVTEILNYFRQTFQACLACGIDPMRLAFDPGIGFGKTVEHNLALLRGLDRVRIEGRPLVLGVSRKSFIHKLADVPDPHDRVPGTIAANVIALERGARVFRVHDVAQASQALKVASATFQRDGA